MATRKRASVARPRHVPAPEAIYVRKPIAALIEELRSWLPNYDHGPESFPHTLYRILASLPGGDRLEDMGYEPMPGIGWHEADLLGRVLEAIENRDDVEALVAGLMDDEEEEAQEPRQLRERERLDRERIQRALAYVHHWEKNGKTRPEATKEAIGIEGLNFGEAGILLNALHVNQHEIERPSAARRPTRRGR